VTTYTFETSVILGDLTVALETAGTPQHDVECEETDGVADIKGLSLWSPSPLADQHPGCIIVNLDVGTENVKVEGWSEKTSCTSPSLPVGNE
jgi:hypothetical protein